LNEQKNTDVTNKEFGDFSELCVKLVLDLAERRCASPGKKTCIQGKRSMRCYACESRLLKLFAENILKDEKVERTISRAAVVKDLAENGILDEGEARRLLGFKVPK
jgi:hypothetical protein